MLKGANREIHPGIFLAHGRDHVHCASSDFCETKWKAIASFPDRPPSFLSLAVRYCKHEKAGWVVLEWGQESNSTMSYIPKPYVGLGSGNETRDCTDTQYEAVNGCQMSLTFHTLLFLLWGKEKVKVNETSFMPLAEERMGTIYTPIIPLIMGRKSVMEAGWVKNSVRVHQSSASFI